MPYKFKEYRKSPILTNHLHMGGQAPDGERIDVTSLYLTRGGKPWIGVMGEYHFVRDSRHNWYRELCKMKAGGITIAATYLFWIYHEETEGVFDFTGDRDIRQFILEAGRAGLDVVIRIGPWAHGECRNGGFPDWLLQKPYKLRDNNSAYLEKVRLWYEQIYRQVQGLFYEDGGNIIGIQFENELVHSAAHLLALKELALDMGYKAPLYTVTGWNSAYGAKIPVDDVLPVFGAYPEAPWTEHTDKLPPSPNYMFDTMRNDSAIGKDMLTDTDAEGWRLPYERYPFATCELGGGIQVTHHRRPLITGMDIYALSLVKLGSGNNLAGYYMYKGGTNKIGGLSTLNESKATGYPNDYSVLSYDFQAPVSEYGEIREQYRLLNMLHLFVNDFGSVLAPMETVEAKTPAGPDDLSSLRYCMRTDGTGGFVFVNHYQRLEKLEDIHGAAFDTGSVQFPPVDVCGDISFIFPFHTDLSGNMLEYATAQLLCREDDAYFFTEIEGITPEYKFRGGEIYRPESGEILKVNNILLVTLSPDRARYARRLSGRLYIGHCCDLYEYEDEIRSVQEGDFTYDRWSGFTFEQHAVKKEFIPAKVTFETVGEPFVPPYADELNIGGVRKRTWKKVTVSGDAGFIEIPDQYDVAQIYADGRLAADNFYYGRPWRVPAKLLYGRECYLVMSEMKDDFYREF
ncbi:MAG: beta-galactosidase [Butyrivibrio sp.]|nr:beta-galactosidase [Acetatifactor muris]MCM1560665.1 beta-galactosidase [Butyrivibrio sp.]